MDLKNIENLSFRIDIDTSDNLKDLCLNCEVFDSETNEYICTIRANTFNELETKIQNNFL